MTVTTSQRPSRSWVGVIVAATVLAAGCSTGDSEPLTTDEAATRLGEQLADVDWREDLQTRAATIEFQTPDLADTLPPIDEFPLVVTPPAGTDIVAEVFASTEKSGTGTDGWMVEVAQQFNDSAPTLADGRRAGIAVRSIASGTGYSFISAGRDLPDGFSPSNELWAQMAAEQTTMTQIAPSLVPNVAGLVMRTATADEVRAAYGEVDASSLIEATIAGEVVTGYTDPFASSTGLNLLVTILDSFAEGDESQYLAPDVASVFEEFQRRVPFVALTTLQLRESVERDGALDAFVMEWQTFRNTPSLQEGYEFIPFGARHDNPLYAVGDADPATVEAMQLFADFSQGGGPQDLARELGFDPPEYAAELQTPGGATLIGAQQLWKDKKDGGRGVSAVFVTDVSGSMEGTRIQAVQRALLSAQGFIQPDARVGMVEFSDRVVKRLPVAEFDLNQQARFVGAVEDMQTVGGTAMYDGILLGLDMLLAEQATDPDRKLLLIVLSDGEVTDGFDFSEVERTVEGLGVPIFTVGFEADLEELGRVSSLVEAASIDATEENVEFQLSALFNAGI